MLKKILLNTFLLCSAIFVFSQPMDFDALRKGVLNAQTNREKAEAMMALGGALSPVQSDLIFSYADSILLLGASANEPFFTNANDYLKAIAYYKKGDLNAAKEYFKRTIPYFKEEANVNYLKSQILLGSSI